MNVRRIYCIGRNYADHAREMGFEPDPTAFFYFLKPADTLRGDGADIPYPPGTVDFQHEVELVVAIGRDGQDIAVGDALGHVAGYAVGNDLTRRDLQLAARDRGRPWEIGKAFDASAIMGRMHGVAEIGHPARGRIWLDVNGTRRQEADLAELMFPVPELIARLSALNRLVAGDLIFTGTPAGVGPLARGDVVTAGIDGLNAIRNRIV